MKNLDLGQTISIFANLGVIAGIFFLGYELQQNNRYLKEQARFNLFQNRISISRELAEYPDLARLYHSQENQELTVNDRLRRDELLHTVFLSWQYDYESVNLGTLEEDRFAVNGIREVWGELDLDAVWQRRRNRYLPEFVQWVDENVVNER